MLRRLSANSQEVSLWSLGPMFEDAYARMRQWPGGLLRPAAPWRVANVVLLVAVAASGVAAYFVLGRQSSAQAQITTGTVQRGSVLSTVSASGNVQPARTVSLSFSGSGKLVAVSAKPGQHVHKGQMLAKLDDSSQAAAVRTARVSLASAEANLASLEQPLTPEARRQNQVAVEQAQSAIANQNTSLRDTVASANQDRQTLEKAVAQARVGLKQVQRAAAANAVSLRNAVGEAKGAWLEAKAAAARDVASLQTALDQAKAQLGRDQAQLASDQNDVATYTAQVSGAGVNDLQAQVDADKAQVADDQKKEHSDKCDLTPAPQPKCANDAYRTSQDQAQLTADQAKLSAAQSAQNAAQSKADSATSAVAADQAKIVNDQSAITNAENAVASGQLKDAQSVNSAYRSYVNAKQSRVTGLQSNKQTVQNAQNSLKSAIGSLNAGTIKDQQSIHTARASVKSTKQSLDSTLAANAVKAAPATAGNLASARAGIASAEASLANAITAQKQQTLFAPAAGTVSAVNGAVGETPGGASSSSSTPTAFITLVDLDRPEVLAGFSESDAAKIHPGQPATIQVDALPNTQLAAHVVSINTTQTVVSNVVTYGVTFLLDRTAPNLKPGMTVSAAVVIAKRDGVLHVPNAAVHTTGGASFVTVIGANGAQTEQAVQTGLVGDDSTEIVGGPKAGQQIVVSTLTSLTSTTQTGGRGGGFGGGGAGFVIPAGGPRG
jgi:HlyD family secretion protein